MTQHKSQAAMKLIFRQCLLGFLVLVVQALEAYGSGRTFGSGRTYGLHRIDRSASPLSPSFGIDRLNRTSFPPGFIFGASTSAFQTEGAWNVDGRGPSIWDTFTHEHPEKIADHSNADVATDSYHRYMEDIELLKYIGADSYRFSISWSRMLPHGKLSGGINRKGVEFYNNLINKLLRNGLEPIVTIFHWDLPDALEKEYGGFLSENVVKDFHDYADLCFKTFGDRVKSWITLNEPHTFSSCGYDFGAIAPGRCSSWMNNNCSGGNSGIEPYRVGHNLLLAHANAVQLYKTKYQRLQKGKIGIALNSAWMVPITNSTLDREASIRAQDFVLGWYLNPIVYGNYPLSLRILVGKRLPRFTSKQSLLLKGSFDFLGVNYYTGMYAGHITTPPNKVNLSYSTDSGVNLTYTNLQGQSIGIQAGSDWLHVYPVGIWELLHYIKYNYKDPIIYITENGVDEINNATLPMELTLQDNFRIRYYFDHLTYVKKAIENGVRVRRYYGWSIVDNFEGNAGYKVRFGINYVDYKTLRRTPKLSAHWFRRFLHK